jgi:hypothetical protein
MTVSLDASLARAVAARAARAGRPIRETAAALAEAARRWAHDPALARELSAAAALTPAMVRHVLPLAAEPIEADALVALHAREAPAAAGPALVAAVVASNVPALALPAIVHGCLAGAATVVKSGRADTVSAPAFQRAIADVDPVLADTIVATYWTGGSDPVEDTLFARSDVVVATGTDATVAGLVRRVGDTVIGYGDRTSVAVVASDVSDVELAELALDVARYEQRGCLSPHAVFVVGDPRRLGERLLAALDRVADDLPAPEPPIATRAAHRGLVDTARFLGIRVETSRGGTMLFEPDPRNARPVGGRTVSVHALAHPRLLDRALPPGAIECVGVARGLTLDAEALRARGVARICPLGRMQRPRIDWPRGQRPPLASLFRVASEPRIQVES